MDLLSPASEVGSAPYAICEHPLPRSALRRRSSPRPAAGSAAAAVTPASGGVEHFPSGGDPLAR